MASWRGLAKALDEFLFPTPHCVACGRDSLDLFCPECEARRPATGAACPVCADRLKGEVCPSCAALDLGVEATLAMGRHEGSWAVAVRRFKYDAPWLAPQFASLVADLVAGRWPLDLVEAVPMYPTRRRERGYNPPTLLAREVARRTGLPFRGRLLRTSESAPQVGLSRARRLQNVEGAFTCAHGPELAGASVLLLDDVMTTGATVRACAAALRRRGAEEVRVVVLARD